MTAQRISGIVALSAATALLVLTIASSVLGQGWAGGTGAAAMGPAMMGSGMMGAGMMGGGMGGMMGGQGDASSCPHATNPPAK